jgi:hypothetical protein
MSKAIFAQLVQDLCVLLQIGNKAEQVVQGQWIGFKGAAFSLVADAAAALPTFSLYVDFGAIPPERNADVCRVLLETNLYLHVEGGPVFTVSEKEGHVVCASRYLQESVSAEQLRESMENFSRMVAEWRKDYFLSVKVDTVNKFGAASTLTARSRETNRNSGWPQRSRLPGSGGGQATRASDRIDAESSSPAMGNGFQPSSDNPTFGAKTCKE